MTATILRFPQARMQTKSLRDAARREAEGFDPFDGPEPVAADLLARRRIRVREAAMLVSTLSPVAWRWHGDRIALYFAAKKHLASALHADDTTLRRAFSVVHAVVGEYWWTIRELERASFRPDACLMTISCRVEEFVGGEELGEDADPFSEESYHACLRPGSNDGEFDWRYVFRV